MTNLKHAHSAQGGISPLDHIFEDDPYFLEEKTTLEKVSNGSD